MPTAALGRMKHSLYASFETDLETALEAEAEARRSAGLRKTTKKA
jgi:hypothetical protein